MKPGERALERGFLLRQFPVVLELVGADGGFELIQTLLGLPKLRLEKRGSFFGLRLTRFHVLFDAQIRQTVGNLCHYRGIRSLIADPERPGPLVTAADGYQLDAGIPAHQLENFFLEKRLSFFRVEAEIVNDLLQIPAAEDLLSDRADAILEIGRNRRRDEFFRDLLRIHQDQGLRHVERRQSPHDGSRAETHQNPDRNNAEFAFPHGPHDGRKGESRMAGRRFLRLRLRIISHVCSRLYRNTGTKSRRSFQFNVLRAAGSRAPATRRAQPPRCPKVLDIRSLVSEKWVPRFGRPTPSVQEFCKAPQERKKVAHGARRGKTAISSSPGTGRKIAGAPLSPPLGGSPRYASVPTAFAVGYWFRAWRASVRADALRSRRVPSGYLDSATSKSPASSKRGRIPMSHARRQSGKSPTG